MTTGKPSFDILYLCFDDISAPKGPSVNEREFLNGLKTSGVPYRAIIPRPAMPVDECKSRRVQTVPCIISSRLGQILVTQLLVLIRAWSALREARGSKLHTVIRLPPIPWSVAVIVALFPSVPIHVKSLGDTEFLRRAPLPKRVLYWPLAAVQTVLVRFVLRRARTIDTVTDKLAARIVGANQLDSEKVHVIPNTTNTDRFKPTSASRDNRSFVVGYVGGHPATRGGRQIIEVMPQISEVIPGVKCRIAGGDVRELEEIARSLGVEDRCEILGIIPYDEVSQFLNSLDVLLATDDGVRAKEIGNSNQKIRQALSVGVPVISNQEAEPDLIGHGLVKGIDTRMPSEVRLALLEIHATSQVERSNFSRRARKLICDKYSLAVSTRRRLRIWGVENALHDPSI